VEEIQKLNEMAKARIENTNASYESKANKHKRKMVFRPGDLVWIHHLKERFPSKRKNELVPRADGPFEVLKRLMIMLIRLIFQVTMELQLHLMRLT